MRYTPVIRQDLNLFESENPRSSMANIQRKYNSFSKRETQIIMPNNRFKNAKNETYTNRAEYSNFRQAYLRVHSFSLYHSLVGNSVRV